MKTVGIIQARMSSTRLPGKVLLPLGGECALWWTVKRVGMADGVDLIVVASTENPADDVIEDYCRDREWPCFRGSEEDVLGRMVACSPWSGAHIIVDVTADCPLVSPEHIEHLVRAIKENELDYASNVMERSWPDGLDVQTYTASALYRMNGFKEEDLKREHSGWNFVMNRKAFSTYNMIAPEKYDLPDLRLTLDTPKDYRLLDRLLREADGVRFSAESMIDRTLALRRCEEEEQERLRQFEEGEEEEET